MTKAVVARTRTRGNRYTCSRDFSDGARGRFEPHEKNGFVRWIADRGAVCHRGQAPAGSLNLWPGALVSRGWERGGTAAFRSDLFGLLRLKNSRPGVHIDSRGRGPKPQKRIAVCPSDA
jgi:hypothetical protein